MGDSIDNIKGVPGIGEKGARDLISTHGSLDALLENAAALTQKKYREALTPTPIRPARAGCCFASEPMCRCRSVEHVVLRLSRRRIARSASSCFRTLGFRSLVTEFAPTADTVDADYRVIYDRGRAGLAGRGARRAPADSR